MREPALKPPPLTEKILGRLVDSTVRDQALGDFEERFRELVRTKSPQIAKWWFRLQLIPVLKSFIANSLFWSGTMFRNYLKIAWRNQKKQKGYSFINIAGLAMGMAASILIVFYIYHELSYDRFHKDADRIYRVCLEGELNKNHLSAPMACYPLGPYLAREFPEVQAATRLVNNGRILTQYADRKYYESDIYYADPSVFDVFTFPFLSGDPRSALTRPYTIVLTERTARKYFASEDAVGKMLRFNNEREFVVTGVIRDIPSNSHFSFSMLGSMETLLAQNPRLASDWINPDPFVYLKLRDRKSASNFDRIFPNILKEHAAFLIKFSRGTFRYYLQPLLDIHLRSHMARELGANGDISNIYILAAIAVFILALACINFMNLATARAAKRAREVGMRKVIGAGRRDLVGQFLGESISICLLALMLALILVRLALPLFKSASGIEVTLRGGDLAWLIPSFFGLAVLVGLAAGSYPAFFLSSFHPVKVLKGTYRSGRGSVRFRRILVVLQFVISVALIIGTAVVRDQLAYMRNKNPGFAKEQVLVTPIAESKIRQSLDAAKARLKQIPDVVQVGAADNFPGGWRGFSPVWPEGVADNQSTATTLFGSDSEFVPALGIELAAGRNFSDEFPSDEKNAALINETAARQFGWKDPVGKSIKFLMTSLKSEVRMVVGVLKDFHMTSLRDMIGPIVIVDNNPQRLDYLIIKVRTSDISGLVRKLEGAWKDLDPDRPFDFFFLDAKYDAQFRGEERLSKIFASFSGLAIAIACLGLFGLASFMAEQRTKEMGIRKVLGAKVGEVVGMMSLEFVRLVGLAVLIAWPIAYFVMKTWLRSFAYRTAVHAWTFLLSGLAALAVAFLTVSFQAFKTASVNPVDSLKDE